MDRWLLHGSEYRDAASSIIQTLTNAAKLAGLDPDCKDADGQTAFQRSIQEPGEDDYIVEAFLKNGFSLPFNALKLAVDSCDLNEENASKVELVLKSKASLNSIQPDGRNVLHQCAMAGSARAACIVLNQPEGACFLNARDNDGETPLFSTIDGQQGIATTKVLIEAGADINALNPEKKPALGSAISMRSTEVASYLLEQNADIWLHEGDWKGCSILVFAVDRDLDSSNPMLPFLLSTDIVDDDDDDDDDMDDHTDKHRFPQLHDSAVLDAIAVEHGNTVLHRAARVGDYVGVFSLIPAGASAEI